MEEFSKLKKIYTSASDAIGEDIGVKSRKHPLPYARFIYFYHARKMTGLSFETIGDYCGGRDHATVMNGEKRYHELIQYDDFRELDRKITSRIPNFKTFQSKRKKAKETLINFNKWRRGADIPQPNPEEIGLAIDLLIEEL